MTDAPATLTLDEANAEIAALRAILSGHCSYAMIEAMDVVPMPFSTPVPATEAGRKEAMDLWTARRWQAAARYALARHDTSKTKSTRNYGGSK